MLSPSTERGSSIEPQPSDAAAYPGSERSASEASRLTFSPIALVAIAGSLSLALYVVALSLGNLRRQTIPFEIIFFTLFGIYLGVVMLVVRARGWSNRTMVVALGFAVLFRVVSLIGPPSLSDDMFRYIWDGRVQAAGYNAYQYAPASPALEALRDEEIWPRINRRNWPTVYTAGTELFFLGIYLVIPNSILWTKVAVTLLDLATIPLLMMLLGRLGLARERVLIYAWSPLVVFEFAHSGHADSLILPPLLGALLAFGRWPWLAGALLGFAALAKLLPALFLAGFMRRGLRRAAIMIGMTALVLVAGYLPYLSVGTGVLGYLPTYVREEFNGGPHRVLANLGMALWGPNGLVVARGMMTVSLLGLAAWLAYWPGRRSDPVRATYFLLAGYLVTALSVHPWYVASLVPFLALYVRPGACGLRIDGATGWLLFSGLVTLSYTYFIQWRRVEPLLAFEWAVLLTFLVLGGLRAPWVRARLGAIGHPALSRLVSSPAMQSRSL